MTLATQQALLALLTLPRMGPSRLRWIGADDDPVAALASLRAGRVTARSNTPRGIDDRLLASWYADARACDEVQLWSAYQDAGLSLLFPGDPKWPFANDPEPPSVLFYRGSLSALHAPARVGIVGTRRCSAVGRQVARTMGLELAAAGLSVVSGLALGIDGAAHTGALAARGAPPVAVVGTGLNHVYPRANRDLWEQVATDGLLLSEAPLGAGPERWRFPARNRLLAGLVDVLVVVESHAKGGALLTVGEAADRGVPVVGVPGSVLAKSCEGSNALLIDGCPPVRDARDVLELLSLGVSDRPSPPPIADESGFGSCERRIVAALSAGATHVNRLIESLGEPAPLVLAALQSLVTDGLVALDGSTAVLGQPVLPGMDSPILQYPPSS